MKNRGFLRSMLIVGALSLALIVAAACEPGQPTPTDGTPFPQATPTPADGLPGDGTPTPDIDTTPGVTPGVTPGRTPGVTPGVTPGRTPGVTPSPSAGTPTPGAGTTPTPSAGAQDAIGLIALAEVGGSALNGLAILQGSLGGGAGAQQGETHVVVSVFHTASALAPDPDEAGQAVILRGTCEAPTGIHREIGMLLPLHEDGVITGTPTPGTGGTPTTGTPTPDADGTPTTGTPTPRAGTPTPGTASQRQQQQGEQVGWILIGTVPFGLQSLATGDYAIAVLDPEYEPTATPQPDGTPIPGTPGQDDLEDAIVSCGVIQEGSILVPDGTPTPGTGTPTPRAGTPTPGAAGTPTPGAAGTPTPGAAGTPTPRAGTPTPGATS